MFPSDINMNNLDLTDATYNNSISVYESKILYNNNDFILCVDKMCLLGIYKEKNEDIIELSFIKSNNMFYTFVYNLDSRIIDLLFTKSIPLFNIQFKKENIEDLYKKCLLVPNNVYECPKLKLVCDENITIYNIDGDKIELYDLHENCEIKMQILFDKIIFEKNKCFIKCVIKCIDVTSNICKQQNELLMNHEIDNSSGIVKDTYSDIINYIQNL